MLKRLCFALAATWPALAAVDTPVAEGAPSAEALIQKIVARDRELVARRRAFDYDIAITREKLDEDGKVTSEAREDLTMRGDQRPGYQTRSSDPDTEAKNQSREEPFELLKIIDHYTYTLEGEETVDGVLCHRIAFTPKPDLPYANREEKVLNNVSGHIWAAVSDCSVIRNEGSLLRPVSVAWIFATLRVMQFHFDSVQLPNGDYGPGRLQYEYLVDIPFFQLHERDTRAMSHYRESK
jgi:hypothetical protein